MVQKLGRGKRTSGPRVATNAFVFSLVLLLPPSLGATQRIVRTIPTKGKMLPAAIFPKGRQHRGLVYIYISRALCVHSLGHSNPIMPVTSWPARLDNKIFAVILFRFPFSWRPFVPGQPPNV